MSRRNLATTRFVATIFIVAFVVRSFVSRISIVVRKAMAALLDEFDVLSHICLSEWLRSSKALSVLLGVVISLFISFCSSRVSN